MAASKDGYRDEGWGGIKDEEVLLRSKIASC